MPERRGFDRVRLGGNVVFRAKDDLAKELDAKLENISFGGFAMCSPCALKVDEVVDFQLNTQAAGESLCGKGIVRHVNLSESCEDPVFMTGIEFTDINEDALTYFFKRILAKISDEIRARTFVRPPDFIPY